MPWRGHRSSIPIGLPVYHWLRQREVPVCDWLRQCEVPCATGLASAKYQSLAIQRPCATGLASDLIGSASGVSRPVTRSGSARARIAHSVLPVLSWWFPIPTASVSTISWFRCRSGHRTMRVGWVRRREPGRTASVLFVAPGAFLWLIGSHAATAERAGDWATQGT